MIKTPPAARRADRIFFFLFAALSLAFIVMGLLEARGVPAPVHSGDAEEFYKAAREPLWSVDFWAGHRPWTTPLIHKLAGYNDLNITRIQLWLALAAHLALAWVFFRFLGGRFSGLLTAAAVFAYALSPWVHGWTQVIRSESLGFSFTALVLACLIVLLERLRRPTPLRRLVLSSTALLGVAGLWIFTRDNWAWQLPLFAALLVVNSFGAPGRRRAIFWSGLALAGALLILFQIQTWTTRRGDRWRPCLMNVIFQRVLPDPVAREHWVRAYGLPWDAQLASLSGKWCFSDDLLGYRLKTFQDWLDRQGRAAYFKDILTRPTPHADAVWRSFRANVNASPSVMKLYLAEAEPGLAPARAMQGLLFAPLSPNDTAPLALALCIALPWGIGLLTRQRRLAACASAVFIFAAGLPLQMAGIYLSDALAEPRHTLAVSITLRLLLVLTLGIILAATGRLVRRLARYRRQELRRLNKLSCE